MIAQRKIKRIFLGGIFLDEQVKSIVNNSHGSIQNAADALQKAIIIGLKESGVDDLSVVNMPFIGSYPQRYKRPHFQAIETTFDTTISVFGPPFLTIRFIKSISRFISAFKGLKRQGREAMNGETIQIIVYSANLPLISAALLYAAATRNAHVCLVLPDFPEFMGSGGIFYRFAKSIESAIFKRLSKRVAKFVVLTDFMALRLNLKNERYIVVEGIFNQSDYAAAKQGTSLESKNFTFLYTGTLAKRYGILDLLSAFSRIKNDNARLQICGEGDAKPDVISYCQRDTRATYLGQVSRDVALSLQRDADVLVNPRRPEGEYTKYSFPSKTLEYMASGKPVIMHSLPGIPYEYHEFLLLPSTPDTSGLASVMQRVLEMRAEELAAIGAKGKIFIFQNKTTIHQGRRIAEFLDRMDGIR